MGNPLKPQPPDDPDALSADERRALQAWSTHTPGAGFAERVMAGAGKLPASAAAAPPAAPPATGRIASSPRRTRAGEQRRRRRRSALATALGAVALSAGGGFVAWQAGSALGLQQATHAGLPIYLAALAFGGVLLIGSLVGGHHQAEAEAGTGLDGGHHAGDGHEHSSDQHDSPATATAYLWFIRPVLSLRFWIFGLTFFGLTGSILDGLRLAAPGPTAVIAIVLGLTTGYLASRLFQSLAHQSVGEINPQGAHVGREGSLLLPVSKGQRGKMRVVVGGVAADLLVESDNEATLPAGTTVLVVGMRGTVALVEPSPAPNESAQEGDKS
jgi:membrane protein implicated in regulation of membrane protease activity